MIILLDTSSPLCRLTLVDNQQRFTNEWSAGRSLAKELLSYLRDQLANHHKTWNDIGAIGVFKGPGSFTGLRIGLTVLNTIADTKNIPIVGTSGDDWLEEALSRISRGDDDKIVLPFYGSDANITKPRK